MHVLSGLYGKLLVSAAAVLLATEVLPNAVPFLYFHGYLFSFLLGGGILSVLCIYMSLVLQKCPGAGDGDDGSSLRRRASGAEVSVFFRMGALVFGLGALSAAGLEVATLYSMESPCVDKLNLVQPVVGAVFTLMQMHFLSLNSQKAVQCLGWCRHLVLMHLCATNVCVWLRLQVSEGTRAWLTATHAHLNASATFPQAQHNVTAHALFSDGRHEAYMSPSCVWLEQEPDQTEGVLTLHQCYQNSTLGVVWDKARPFITPFVVQFCLMGAAVTYALWAGLGDRRSGQRGGKRHHNSWSPRHTDEDMVVHKSTKVDCKGSSKGLFLGLVVLAIGLVALILFFVLTNNPELRDETLFLMVGFHAALLGLSLLGSLGAAWRVGRMCAAPSEGPPPGHRLHALLQEIGVVAVYLHGVASIVVGAMQWRHPRHLAILVDGAAMVLQSAAQSVLFHRIRQRGCSGAKCPHQGSRPGRQSVTFLAFVNLVLWVTESFTDHNHVSSQLQLRFFGPLPWQLASRLALPLVMFYRFESAVFLMEAWKYSYAPPTAGGGVYV